PTGPLPLERPPTSRQPSAVFGALMLSHAYVASSGAVALVSCSPSRLVATAQRGVGTRTLAVAIMTCQEPFQRTAKGRRTCWWRCGVAAGAWSSATFPLSCAYRQVTSTCATMVQTDVSSAAPG